MGISERRQREKEQRRTEILAAAEKLFFQRKYDEVSMDGIAREVELNKATLYLYFGNKEALYAAIVLRGITILNEKFAACMAKPVPGIVKIALLGQAYYEFSQEHPEYLRMIHFYGTEQFSQENPCTADAGKGYGSCRLILRDAIREGIADGTIRKDLDPFLGSMYLMIAFMGTLSMEEKWKAVIRDGGFGYDEFCSGFFRFILPAIATKEGSGCLDPAALAAAGFRLAKLPEEKNARKK